MLTLANGSTTTSMTLDTPVAAHAREMESIKQSTFAMAVVEASVAWGSTRLALASAGSIALVLLGASACGFPRPADVGVDAPGGTDGSAGPIVAIHASSPQISQIALAAGTYSTSNGENFPYILPASITVIGPAGGAIIAGNKTVPGVTVDAGGLQDLSLQDFATAVTVTGAANLKNVQILTSMVAVQAEATASLTVNNLDIIGVTSAVPAGCSTGIVMNGAAKLVATTLTTHGVLRPLDARDQSVVAIANATIDDKATCSGGLMVMSAASFSLSDSLVDSSVGIYAQSTSFHATISNTIIRGVLGDSLLSRVRSK